MEAKAAGDEEDELEDELEAEVITLEAATWLQEGGASRLLVRKCYQGLAALLNKHLLAGSKDYTSPTSVLTGTPGVGKSQFLVYYLLEILRAPRGFDIVIDFDKGSGVFPRPAAIGATSYEFRPVARESLRGFVGDSTTLYIFDARKDTIPIPRTGVEGPVLIACSPNDAYVSGYKSYTELYMPLWTLSELLLLAKHCYPERELAAVRRRFQRWGGTARNAVVYREDEVDSILTTKLKGMDFQVIDG